MKLKNAEIQTESEGEKRSLSTLSARAVHNKPLTTATSGTPLAFNAISRSLTLFNANFTNFLIFYSPTSPNYQKFACPQGTRWQSSPVMAEAGFNIDYV